MKKLLLSLILVPLAMFSQDKMDSLSKEIKAIQSKTKVLDKLKFSGYLHAQFQLADTAGIASFAGGDFGTNVRKRFMVRRGRIKASYAGKHSLYVIQIDVTERKVGIRDAYARLTDKWLRFFHVQVGVFDRPFGFEIGYSSSLRETPERGRMSQILFPSEKDLGAMFVFNPHKEHALNYLKFEFGVFNGSGHETPDFDSFKELMGRLRIDRKTKSEKFRYGLGVSMLQGGWINTTSSLWNIGKDSAGIVAFTTIVDTTIIGKEAGKSMIGADIQLSMDWPLGTTTLRAEYIAGNTPGTYTSLKSLSALPTGDNYMRNFNGAYLYFIQDLGKTKHQIVVKYDWFDPNTDVSAEDIGRTVTSNAIKTGPADVKFSTLGFGWNYLWDENLKLVLYYDMVTNENCVNQAGFTRDKKDNVITARLQFRF